MNRGPDTWTSLPVVYTSSPNNPHGSLCDNADNTEYNMLRHFIQSNIENVIVGPIFNDHHCDLKKYFEKSL